MWVSVMCLKQSKSCEPCLFLLAIQEYHLGNFGGGGAFQFINSKWKSRKRFHGLTKALNQCKDDIQITAAKSDLHLGRPELNLLLADLKEKKVCLTIGNFLVEADRGMNLKDVIIDDGVYGWQTGPS